MKPKPKTKAPIKAKTKVDQVDASTGTKILARGVMFPRTRRDPGTVPVGFVFYRDVDGAIRLSMQIEPGAGLSREAWGVVWMILKAEFKSWSEMGKRRPKRRRFRRRVRRRTFTLPGGGPRRTKKKSKAAATAPTASSLPSGDLVAVAAEALKDDQRGHDDDPTGKK